MDTSDSEHFESADEDIQSDEDEKITTKSITDHKLCENDPPSSRILRDKEQQSETHSDVGGEQKQSINEDISKEDHLNLKLKNVKLDGISSTSQKEGTEVVINSDKNSEDAVLADCVEKDEKPNETAKKNRKNMKSKLGCKTTKEFVNFEESPKKQNLKSSEPIVEIGNTGDNTENVHKLEEENLWDDDELDWGAEAIHNSKTVSPSSQVNPTRKISNNPQQNAEDDGWSSWSNWGVSVFSTATQSVSSITSQITNVIETGLGAVDPEELARIEQEEKKKSKVESVDNKGNIDQSENSYGGFGLGNLVKLVEDTGTKVISGGLDTLESLGKKTMEVLQEGDPGLKKKRAFLKIDQDKPVLSQILREAKERAESESRTQEAASKKKFKNYETLFDDHHGLVHLEALELLSKQCEIKLKVLQSSMSGDEFADFSETMDQIKELCELPDEDDEEQPTVDEVRKKLEKAVSEMNVQITYEKLVANWEEMEIWLSTLDLEICDVNEVHQQAIETLAEMTSRAMEQFHKTGELLLVKKRRSTADEADSLVQITATLISLIGIVAAKFCDKLNVKAETNKEVSGLITNVFFEAANSSSYIQDALQLLIPVLQVGAT